MKTFFRAIQIFFVIILTIFVAWTLYGESIIGARIEDMKELIPDAVETFEKSKEKLEILRNGKLAKDELKNHTVRTGSEGIYLDLDLIDSWDSFPHVPKEEQEAIDFLFYNPELPINFIYWKKDRGVLKDENAIVMEIRYTTKEQTAPVVVDLGDGYVLIIEFNRHAF